MIKPVDGGVTYVVLLHDGGVEGVEVEEEDACIIEALLRLQHQSTRVRRLPLPTSTTVR